MSLEGEKKTSNPAASTKENGKTRKEGLLSQVVLQRNAYEGKRKGRGHIG